MAAAARRRERGAEERLSAKDRRLRLVAGKYVRCLSPSSNDIPKIKSIDLKNLIYAAYRNSNIVHQLTLDELSESSRFW
jgi:hypothetical protein